MNDLRGSHPDPARRLVRQRPGPAWRARSRHVPPAHRRPGGSFAPATAHRSIERPDELGCPGVDQLSHGRLAHLERGPGRRLVRLQRPAGAPRTGRPHQRPGPRQALPRPAGVAPPDPPPPRRRGQPGCRRRARPPGERLAGLHRRGSRRCPGARPGPATTPAPTPTSTRGSSPTSRATSTAARCATRSTGSWSTCSRRTPTSSSPWPVLRTAAWTTSPPRTSTLWCCAAAIPT